MAVDLILFLVGWGAGWWLLWRVPVPPEVDAEAALDRTPVSVIVPARDEEAVLPVLLASLSPQLRSDDELIVVDDHSDDATAVSARAGGASVVRAPALPAGWTGKAWACHHGAARATRATLIFLDADTRLEPGGLERLTAGLAATGGLYSVQPWHEVNRPHERLAAVFNVVAMMGTTAFAPGREGRAAVGAFGPCLVTSVADYRRAGGHESVASTVLDDLALADRYREVGLPVTVHGGKGTISFRMYPLGFGQLVEGFTKNFAVAARAVGLATTGLITLWLAALSAPVVLATMAPVPAAICYAAAAAQMGAHLRRLGSFGARTAVLYPLALAVFIAVFARSVVSTLIGGRVRWKGRDVATRRRPPRAS